MKKLAFLSAFVLCASFSFLQAQEVGESAVPYYHGNGTSSNNSSNTYRYGLLSLENTTRRTISYEYRWGDGNWKNNALAPGKFYRHWWNYEPGSNSSPKFYIRYHDGRQTVEAQLKRNRSQDTTVASSKQYYFAGNGGRGIDLYIR